MVPDGWERFFVVDGIVLAPPEPGVGRVRIRERVAPRPIRAFVDELLAAPSATLTLPPRALVTGEGEEAALFEVEARLGAVTARRTIGLVIGDDTFTAIDGHVEVPARFAEFRATVESLTRATCLGLGADRWRRFWYRPPPGWTPLPATRGARWLAPGHPRRPSIITVFPARPASPAARDHAGLFEDLPREFQTVSRTELTPACGLVGQLARHERGDRIALEVHLDANRFLHRLRLETERAFLDEERAIFLALVESVEPLPSPAQDLGALAAWTD